MTPKRLLLRPVNLACAACCDDGMACETANGSGDRATKENQSRHWKLLQNNATLTLIEFDAASTTTKKEKSWQQ